MTFDKLRELTHAWADARGIVKNGKVSTQLLKLVSEYGELCEAVIAADEHEIRDAIGDMMVVISNVASIEGIEPGLGLIDAIPSHIPSVMTIGVKLGDLCDASIKGQSIQLVMRLLIAHLYHYAERDHGGLLACWEGAYGEIKDRKGYLNEHGNFIKEEDNG